jgi:hypothetical protein
LFASFVQYVTTRFERMMKYSRIFLFLLFCLSLPAGAVSDQRKECAPPNDKPGCAKKAPPRHYSPPVSIERPATPSPAPARQPVAPAAQPGIAQAPPGPAAVNTCDAGGCWGAGGTRYQGGTGDVYLDRGGRPCLRTGAWMQCN